MAKKLFFGNETTSGIYSVSANYHVVSAFQSSFSGLISEIRAYSSLGGASKFGLYSSGTVKYDSASTLVYSNDTGLVMTASSWNIIDVSASPILVNNTDWYHFSVNNNSTNAIASTTSGSPNYWAFKPATYSTFSHPNPMGAFTQSNNAQLIMAAYGWAAPTVTGISTTILKNGMTGVIVSGADFMSSGASLYACPTDSYAEVNELPITGQTDTEITFDVSGLTPGQSYFLFIKTSLGQHNVSGTEVSVISSYIHDPRKRNFHPEFLRGALFGESFQSEIRTEYSGAAIIGTPTFSRFSGFTSDGTAQLSYSIDAAFPSHGSLVCAFKGTSDGLVVSTADLSGGTPSDGYCAWVDSDGYVHASISDGALIDTLLVDDANFLDGEWHVLTYTTDLTRGIHSLLVDQYYSASAATVSGTIGSGKSLLIGDTGGFAGSVRGLKVFNESLSHREHMLYARVVEE